MADAKLARCPRCKAYVLVAERSGIRIAVDITPADAIAYGIAIAQGPIDFYWVESTPGRPSRVLGRYSGTPRPSWGPGGSQTGTQRLHAEHSCGAPARDMVILDVQRPKDQAPATPGAPGAGNLLHDALAAVARDRDSRSPAPSATHRPSEVLGRCGICDRRIQPGESYWSITHGRDWIAGTHEECP